MPTSESGPESPPDSLDIRVAWSVLGVAMIGSAALILSKGSGASFSGDDLYYYARLIGHGDSYGHLSLDYILAPHNGHLVSTGKLIYEAVFGIAGPNYTILRCLNLAGFLLSIGLFFELARRAVGPLLALAPSLLLLFFGYAWESVLWPFNLHTLYALAAGLGSLLALQRRDHFGDALACVLLILAISLIELGLAFLAGVAVSVLLRDDRLRRAWIFLLPLFLYAAWWIWARKFDQGQGLVSSIPSMAESIANSPSAVLGALLGRNPTGATVFPGTVGHSTWGWVLAALAAAALVWRIARGAVPTWLWVALAVVLTYWAFIAAAARPPDSSRYMLVGAIGVLLVTAYGIGERRIPVMPVIAGSIIVGVLAIPAYVRKLNDGRRYLLGDAQASRTEYAMLDLAHGRVSGGYAPFRDPAAINAGPAPLVGLYAGDYFRAAHQHGSIGYTLQQVREQDSQIRLLADVVLTDALGLKLTAHASEPPKDCHHARPGSGSGAAAELPAGGAVLRATGAHPTSLRIRRFSDSPPNIKLGRLATRRWSELRVPRDVAPDPWQVFAAGPFVVCPLP